MFKIIGNTCLVVAGIAAAITPGMLIVAHKMGIPFAGIPAQIAMEWSTIYAPLLARLMQ